MPYKKGDIVKVYSLQSFHGGGFLNGDIGRVSQDQIGSSVLVAVERKIDGKDQIDPHYEVYERQLELVSSAPVNKVELKRIFSGDYSQDMWNKINRAETETDLRNALYLVCTRLQELEDQLERRADQ